MDAAESLETTQGYKLFRNWVAQQKVCVNHDAAMEWKYYDYGPRDVPPLICLPDAGGTAEMFFRQIVSLCPKGYRIIAVQYPAYQNHRYFIEGLDRFLRYIRVFKAHFLGASLGGYLAQCYAAKKPSRVLSLILCNSFVSTQYFEETAPFSGIFSWMPLFVLQRHVMSRLPQHKVDPPIAKSIDFAVQQMETLSQSDLCSQLSLNCNSSSYSPSQLKLRSSNITIIRVLDDVTIPNSVLDELERAFSDAKIALMKQGGNFPYLAYYEEFNLYVEVHLRNHGIRAS